MMNVLVWVRFIWIPINTWIGPEEERREHDNDLRFQFYVTIIDRFIM